MDESPAIPPPIATPLAQTTTVRCKFRRPGPRAWVRIGAAATHATVFVNGREVGSHLGAWTPFEFEVTDLLNAADTDNALEIRCEDRVHTTNGFLPTIGVRWVGVRPRYIGGGGVSIRTPFVKDGARDEPALDIDIADRSLLAPRGPAPQRSSTCGTQLLVDGRPFVVRGILHWGYYPELGHPWPGEAQMRCEITDLKSLGFNLIKFCLWVPPPRYYELCDELGMLVWQEYPVWNAPLPGAEIATGDNVQSKIQNPGPKIDSWSVVSEFRELFLQDRAYPCIILRTLTCENDHVAPEMSRRLVDLAHELIPGCLVLDNSGWLCNECSGDFHDEHPYVHNALWPFYAARMRGKLSKPLLLGETMVADTLNEELIREGTGGDSGSMLHESYRQALDMRRFQIETLTREMPDVGYVICGLRDLKRTPLGLYSHTGRLKYTPQDWAWHAALSQTTPTAMSAQVNSDSTAPATGPRKGAWKCTENTWWSPIVRVLDERVPADLVMRHANRDLLSGRVLTHAEDARVLVEQWDIHSGTLRRNPLVIEFRSEGRWRFASAFRHDTAVGDELWRALQRRADDPAIAPPPEIGPLIGTSIVLEEWEMALPGWPSSIRFEPGPLDWFAIVDRAHSRDEWTAIACDAPYINAGRTVFEGWARFRTRFDYPGGKRILRCESIGDYFEVYIDGVRLAEFGPRHGTWDGTRDIPRNIEVDLSKGRHDIVFVVRDWRAAGGMVGPVFLACDLNERIF